MFKEIYHSIVSTLILVVITCAIYPLTITVFGQLFFHDKATGVGSLLIGQSFSKPGYFHGRPSAAGNGYDASNSSGSNLGPTNQKGADAVKANIEKVMRENPTINKADIPGEWVTASASGLDPHISPKAAALQAFRVASARKVSPEVIQKLILQHIEGPQLGFLGEPVVNVLLLNLDLDKAFQLDIDVPL